MAGYEVTKPVLDAPLPNEAEPPLTVDLDGTVLKTNLAIETLLTLLKQKPLCLFMLPFWRLKGKSLWQMLTANGVELDVRALPYRRELLNYLRAEHDRGRTIALRTAVNNAIAREVADYLGFVDWVLPSDGVPQTDRVFPGNALRPFPVDERLRKRQLSEFLKPLRLHHWLKNLLLFVPLLAAHRYTDVQLIAKAVLAFVAFGLCASGGYVLNDLLDLAADRHHPKKRLRAFAAGELPLSYGLVIVPVVLVLASIIALILPHQFLAMLWLYFALTLTYSLYVRRIVVLDVILLAGLYTMRIMAGSAAVGLWPSQWLLAFSTFLFLSLALVKRYSDLVIMRRVDGDQAKTRGYQRSDQELLAAMGIGSGYVSVLVLALYVDSNAAHNLYGRTELIWFLCPLLLYWVSRMWLFAHRGKMPEDPLVFAMRDRVSQILTALMGVVLVLAL